MPAIQNIVLLVAMEVEAKSIIKRLNLKPLDDCFDSDLPMKAYQSTDATPLKVTLVSSGKCKNFKVDRIGKEAAVLMTWESIRIFKPDLIINAGTAGGFKHKGAHIGDVYIGTLFHYHDRLFHPIEEFVGYGIGKFVSYDLTDIANRTGLKSGVVSTGNALVASREETEQMKKNNADLKEMEAAAIAEIADLKNIPMIAIKTVTDFVDIDSPTQEQFLQNYRIALQNLSLKLEMFMCEIAQCQGQIN